MIIRDADRCQIATTKGCEGCNYSDEEKLEYGNCYETPFRTNFAMKFEEQRRSHRGKVSGGDPWKDISQLFFTEKRQLTKKYKIYKERTQDKKYQRKNK